MPQESYFAPSISHEPHLVTQSELHDLIRDLELFKIKAELLASRLQQWNALADGLRISKCRNRQEELEPFYVMEGNLVACRNVNELTVSFNIVIIHPNKDYL